MVRKPALLFIGLALLTFVGVASAWTGPSQTAPNGNISAPFNVGSTFQDKAGSVWFDGGLGVNNGSPFCIGTSCITAWSQAVSTTYTVVHATSATKGPCGFYSIAYCPAGSKGVSGATWGAANDALQDINEVTDANGNIIGFEAVFLDSYGGGACYGNNFTSNGTVSNGTYSGSPPGFIISQTQDPNKNGNGTINTYMSGAATAICATAGTGAGVGGNFSDARLKQDIAPLTGNLAKVLQLQPVSYWWKDPTRGRGEQIGFIAQQVQPVVPQLVSTDPASGMYTLDYEHMAPLLVGSVQELNATIEEQQRQIDAQQKEMDEFKAELSALKH